MKNTFAVPLVPLSAFLLAAAIAMPAFGQTAAEAPKPDAPKAEKPKTYMVIAAVGEQFTVMFRVSRVGLGTNIKPNFSRKSVTVKNNVLNRFVLHSMDEALAKADPTSKRLFMTLRPKDMDAVKLKAREQVAIDEIIADLKGMPERQEWDRIVAVTPAYKAFEYNGVDGELAGFGVFYQPYRNVDMKTGGARYFDGEDAVTPENMFVRSSIYAAPFSMIDIWILDPRTLAVLDKQQRYDNIKLFDPLSDSVTISGNVTPEVLFDRFSTLVDRSVTAAVERSELLAKRPQVDVGNVKEINPGDAKK
jgi:hypothetical protein